MEYVLPPLIPSTAYLHMICCILTQCVQAPTQLSVVTASDGKIRYKIDLPLVGVK